MLNPTSPLPLQDPTLFRQANCIDGKWVQADSGRTIVVKNPATGEAIGEVPALGAAETRRAIEAAEAGWSAGAPCRAGPRGDPRKRHGLMLANTEDLALIMTAEQGKPLTESERRDRVCGEVHRVVRGGGQADVRRYRPATPGRRILVLKEPIGVSAAITPWNFPTAMITRKAGPGWRSAAPIDPPREPDAVLGIGAGGAGGARGYPPGVSIVHRAPGEPAANCHLEPVGAQADVHGIHRGGAPSCSRSARRP